MPHGMTNDVTKTYGYRPVLPFWAWVRHLFGR